MSKWTVSLISSDSLSQEGNAGFTTVPLKHLCVHLPAVQRYVWVNLGVFSCSLQFQWPISYSYYYRYNYRSYLSIYTALVMRNHSVTMVERLRNWPQVCAELNTAQCRKLVFATEYKLVSISLNTYISILDKHTKFKSSIALFSRKVTWNYAYNLLKPIFLNNFSIINLKLCLQSL